MTQYVGEHDRHLSTLISGDFKSKDYASALADKICRLEQDLNYPGNDLEEADLEATIVAKVEELRRLEKEWDRMQVENEGCESKGEEA